MGTQFRKKSQHFIIILISLALIIFSSIVFINVLCKASKDKPPLNKIDKAFSHAEELSFNIYQNWTQSLAQITILLFGAIWGFIISQKIIFTTKKNSSLWIAFLVPNICFSFEHILYTKSVGRFVEMFFQLNIVAMEKGCGYFYLLPRAQTYFFLFGILTSIAFILLVLFFKKKDMIDLYKN